MQTNLPRNKKYKKFAIFTSIAFGCALATAVLAPAISTADSASAADEGSSSSSLARRSTSLQAASPKGIYAPLTIVTHWGRNPHPVRSVEITNIDGSGSICRDLGYVSGGDHSLEVLEVGELPTMKYEVYSYSGRGCKDVQYFIGSHGEINLSLYSSQFIVYYNRPPQIFH